MILLQVAFVETLIKTITEQPYLFIKMFTPWITKINMVGFMFADCMGGCTEACEEAARARARS